jgi:hypothetical protein
MDNGALSNLSGSPFPYVNGGLFTATGSYLYSGVDTSESKGEIVGLQIHPTSGGLTQAPGSPFYEGSLGPNIVWADFRTRYLWAYEYQTSLSAQNGLQTFAIDPLTGALTETGSILDFPVVQSLSLVEDSTGSFLFTGTQDTGTGLNPDLISWRIRSDGTLEQVTSLNVLDDFIASIAVVTKNPN